MFEILTYRQLKFNNLSKIRFNLNSNISSINCVLYIISYTWDSVVVKALLVERSPGSIPGRVTVDFFPKHPTSPCAPGGGTRIFLGVRAAGA
jgi:hypothetical protein